jgi:hypothetical protein
MDFTGFAVLAAALSCRGPAEKMRLYFRSLATSGSLTQEALEPILAVAVAAAAATVAAETHCGTRPNGVTDGGTKIGGSATHASKRAAADARLVKSLLVAAFAKPGKDGKLGEMHSSLSEDGFLLFLEHSAMAETVLDHLFVGGLGVSTIAANPAPFGPPEVAAQSLLLGRNDFGCVLNLAMLHPKHRPACAWHISFCFAIFSALWWAGFLLL